MHDKSIILRTGSRLNRKKHTDDNPMTRMEKSDYFSRVRCLLVSQRTNPGEEFICRQTIHMFKRTRSNNS